MAITTLDGVLAGMQIPRIIAKSITATLVAGRPASLWSLAGSPGAGAFDNTLNGVTLTGPVNGQIPRTNPSGGNAYLARLTAGATQAGVLMVLDRIWHNGGITITSNALQAIASPAWPTRSADGTANGDGVLLAVEVSAATGAGTPTLTLGYTNSAGTAGRSATNVIATVASSAIGATYFIGLQDGDTGVRSVEGYTQSATWTSGTVNVVAYRVLAVLPVPIANGHNEADAVTLGMPRIYDGTVPWLVFIPNTTTATIVTGSYVETHG